MDRRAFVTHAGILAGSASSMTAQSYNLIMGANDRIRLGQLGCGDRSHGHVHMAQLAARQTPVETVAVCDLWSLARERRASRDRNWQPVALIPGDGTTRHAGGLYGASSTSIPPAH